jgi:hypothetical protein
MKTWSLVAGMGRAVNFMRHLASADTKARRQKQGEARFGGG